MRKVSCMLVILAMVACLYSVANAEIMTLGENGEFAVEVLSEFNYYTPTSDLSGLETTAGYMFNNYDQYVCYVTSEHNTALIAYYETGENSCLSKSERIKTCLELEYDDAGQFYDYAFVVFPYSSGYEIYQAHSDFSGTTRYYSTFFVMLEHGVIVISANGNDKNVSDFTKALFDSIYAPKSNTFID